MKIIGITAEYNPFHKGHALQLELARSMAEAIVVVQSGPFCQRGDVAVQDTWTRAETAVAAGADLVLQLPVEVSLRSAEGFAAGAVEALEATGIVQDILCGAEDPEAFDVLIRAAEIRRTEPEAYRRRLHEELAAGESWGEASFRALAECLDLQNSERLILRKPNNLLATAYALALGDAATGLVLHSRFPGGDKPVPFRLRGRAFKAEATLPNARGNTAPAAVIRARIRGSERLTDLVRSTAAYLPPASRASLYRDHLAGRLLNNEDLLLPALTVLGRTTETELECFFTEGLGQRLQAASHKIIRRLDTDDASFETFVREASSRRCPENAVRRRLLRFLLGPEFLQESPRLPFLLVLAYNRKGRYLLRRMRRSTAVPLITKGSDLLTLEDKAAGRRELSAHRFRRLLNGGRGPELFTQVPRQVKSVKFKKDPNTIRYSKI